MKSYSKGLNEELPTGRIRLECICGGLINAVGYSLEIEKWTWTPCSGCNKKYSYEDIKANNHEEIMAVEIRLNTPGGSIGSRTIKRFYER